MVPGCTDIRVDVKSPMEPVHLLGKMHEGSIEIGWGSALTVSLVYKVWEYASKRRA